MNDSCTTANARIDREELGILIKHWQGKGIESLHLIRPVNLKEAKEHMMEAKKAVLKIELLIDQWNGGNHPTPPHPADFHK